MSVFDNVTIRIPNQEKISCPFCESNYINEGEYRPFVMCPACHGTGKQAALATKEVEEIIENLDKYSVQEIEKMLSKLGAGLHRAEIRAYLVKHRNVIAS